MSPASLDEFRLLLAVTKLRQPLSDVVYALGATRTVFRPYQFKPLLKLLQTNSQRLLIADEVGLGKTIEAGLIWTELHQRAEIRRALVVCPAALTRKWRSEMKRRFDVDLEIITRSRVEEFAEELEAGNDPSLIATISLESLRSARVLEDLAALRPRFDLIIVDEAHYLRNRDTRSFALGELLADWSDVLLFLSATPLNLGTDDLFNLLNLLAEDEFPDSVHVQRPGRTERTDQRRCAPLDERSHQLCRGPRSARATPARSSRSCRSSPAPSGTGQTSSAAR